MSFGDQNDMLWRIKNNLTTGWFGDLNNTPVLDAWLSAPANSLARQHSFIQFVALQSRIATATDISLDMIANDFFGLGLLRLSSEADRTYRRRIQANLFLPRNTRAAMINNLTLLTGNVPTIFEFNRPGDTGAYSGVGGGFKGLAYGVCGGYGSITRAFQCMISIQRPVGGGIAGIDGYNGTIGGYGAGAIMYASLSAITGNVTDQDILDTINNTRPVGVTCWTNITG